MELRGMSWAGQDYRYGFNGKEKDQSGEFGGNTTYDYGFRINNGKMATSYKLAPAGDVDWAKVYKFDENWNYNDRNLDDGNLFVDEAKEMMHYTTAFLTLYASGTKVVNTGKPIIDKAANYLIVTTGKTVVKKTVDYSNDYHK